MKKFKFSQIFKTHFHTSAVPAHLRVLNTTYRLLLCPSFCFSDLRCAVNALRVMTEILMSTSTGQIRLKQTYLKKFVEGEKYLKNFLRCPPYRPLCTQWLDLLLLACWLSFSQFGTGIFISVQKENSRMTAISPASVNSEVQI